MLTRPNTLSELATALAAQLSDALHREIHRQRWTVEQEYEAAKLLARADELLATPEGDQ